MSFNTKIARMPICVRMARMFYSVQILGPQNTAIASIAFHAQHKNEIE